MVALVKPAVGAATWGGTLNTALDKLNVNYGSSQIIKPRAGQYHTSPLQSAPGQATGVAHATGQIVFFPWLMDYAQVWDSIGCKVSPAGSVGSQVRMGVYTADATTGLPASLIVGTAALASDAAGFPQAAITYTATLKEVVWIAYTTSAATTVPSVASRLPTHSPFGATSLPGEPHALCMFQTNFAFAALPAATTPANFTFTEATPPVVSLRAA